MIDKFPKFLALAAILTAFGSASAALGPGMGAPDFTLPTTTGEEITLSDFQGRIVILHFWKSN